MKPRGTHTDIDHHSQGCFPLPVPYSRRYGKFVATCHPPRTMPNQPSTVMTIRASESRLTTIAIP